MLFLGGVGRSVVVVSAFLLLGLCACAAGTNKGNPQALQLFAVSPALFVENQGQWSDASVRYVHDGASVDVAVTDSGVRFLATKRDSSEPEEPRDFGARELDLLRRTDETTRKLQFSVSFVNASQVRPVGLKRSQSLFNYCVGDRSNWRQNVPAYEVAAYEGLYDGIDLHVQGLRSHLKYEFHVAPDADYRQIAICYEGIEGLSIGEDGSLLVDLGGEWGTIRDDAPYIYQEIDGRKVEVAGRFVLIGHHAYSFEVTGSIDAEHELVIDPDLVWSTYLGAENDVGRDITVDPSGDVLVVVGNCVAKIDPMGSRLLWATYLDGDTDDVAVDASGNVLVTGTTSAAGWVSGGFDPEYSGGDDGFVAKLDSTGSHLWSTYLGGSSIEWAYGIAVDASGNVLVAGGTYSAGWVSGGAYVNYGGGGDGFVVKLDPTGSHLWSTYIGGGHEDACIAIAVDASDNVLVTGDTFPHADNPACYALVTKFSPTGSHLWSTNVGAVGGNHTEGRGIAVDSTDNVLLTGVTYPNTSSWVSGGFDTDYGGDGDAFVAKLDSAGTLLWSTYLGGSEAEYGYSIAVDASDNALVTGYTASADWVWGGFDTDFDGSGDGFIVKLSPSGSHLWSTYLGGSGNDWGCGIAADSSGNVFVTGSTSSGDWVSGGFDTIYDVSPTGFVAKLTPGPSPSDLVPTSVVVTPNGRAHQGQVLDVNVAIYNRGGVDSVPCTSTIYWSADSVITADDNDIGTVPTPAISAGQYAVVLANHATVPVTATAGQTYYVGVIVDTSSDSGETNTGNSTSTAVPITVTEPMPPGKWTIVIHGLSWDPYSTLLDPNHFYGILGAKISTLSDDVLLLGHNASDGAVYDVNDGHVYDPNELPSDKHCVLFVDWAGVSNLVSNPIIGLPGEWLKLVRNPPEAEGASGEDGYAEASAEALFSLLAKYHVFDPANHTSTINEIIAHSRGAVVASELVQRMAARQMVSPHTAFLDAEGGNDVEVEVLVNGVWVPLNLVNYADSGFYAWRSGYPGDRPLVNYFDGDFGDITDILGPQSIPPKPAELEIDAQGNMTHAVNVPISQNLSHSGFWRYLADNAVLSTSGGYVDTPAALDPNGLLLSPAAAPDRLWDDSITAAGPDPFANPDPTHLVNGDFEYQSTAGWYYHGGGGTGEVTNKDGNSFLELSEGNQCRMHDWVYVEPGKASLKFDASIPTAGGTPSNPEYLRVVYSGEDGNTPIWSMPLHVAAPSWGTSPTIPLPAWASGDTGRLEFCLKAASDQSTINARVQIDNVRWVQDEVPDVLLHDWNGDGIVSIVGDVPPFVRCVYFSDCPDDVDTIAVGDCNHDGILSIVGDVPCFVECVYFSNCPE
ncbi:MAG: SBBP repeat-containing protein [Phycisphaerales bacterium]